MARRQRSGDAVPLEIRSRVDWAWYDGSITREGSKLRIHFNGFGVAEDELWDDDFLQSSERITNLIRLQSKQLQDSDCKKVRDGMIVCALFTSADASESKYYDAFVIEVKGRDHAHSPDQEDEICMCEFLLEWAEGPAKTTRVSVGCADISFIDKGSIAKHPVAGELLQEARELEKKCTSVKRKTEQISHVEKNDIEDLSPDYSEKQRNLDVLLTKLEDVYTSFQDTLIMSCSADTRCI